jgi:thiamine transport system substrate-binding protein
MLKRFLLVYLVIGLLITGCTGVPGGAPDSEATTAPATGGTVTVMTHDSFSVSEPVVAAFQEQCGCQVQFLKSGDTGLALNKAILSKGNPLADVFFGVDNSFMSRALAADIFEPMNRPSLATSRTSSSSIPPTGCCRWTTAT